MSGLAPRRTHAYAHGKRNRQLDGVLHFPPDDRLDGLALPRRDFQNELVVDLQQDARAHPLHRIDHGDHGELDDVRRRSLDRGVEGHAFGRLPRLPVGRVEIGKISPTAEDRLSVSLFAGLLDEGVKIRAHPAEA